MSRDKSISYRLEQMNGHKNVVIWFTGLSGAGKSTLAYALEDVLHRQGVRTYVLDGDNIRRGLCKDLGFSVTDRTENIRRVSEVSKLMMEAGIIVIVAFISPFNRDRQIARELIGKGRFIEIYCDVSIDVCRSRDVKGLYDKAYRGQIADFTGISSPYEAPLNPEISLETGHYSIEACINKIGDQLYEKDIITKWIPSTEPIEKVGFRKTS